MSGFSSYPFSGSPRKFFDPEPAMAYEPTPSSAIAPRTAVSLDATFDIRTSPGRRETGRKPVRTTYAARLGSVLCSRELVQVRLEHRLDLRGACTPVQPRKDALVLDENEGRDDFDP